jgi:hypothetical protein
MLPLGPLKLWHSPNFPGIWDEYFMVKYMLFPKGDGYALKWKLDDTGQLSGIFPGKGKST